jgi:hypothetical protein
MQSLLKEHAVHAGDNSRKALGWLFAATFIGAFVGSIGSFTLVDKVSALSPPRLVPVIPAAPPAPSQVAPPPATGMESGSLYLQIGAFAKPEGAQTAARVLRRQGFQAQIVPDRNLRCVLVGPFPARSDAVRVQAELEKLGYTPLTKVLAAGRHSTNP